MHDATRRLRRAVAGTPAYVTRATMHDATHSRTSERADRSRFAPASPSLGARTTVNVTPPFVDRPTRQLDRVHPLASAYVRRRMEASGWSVEQEVPIGSRRTIGWIDLLAFDEPSATLLLKEIKTELLDIGQVQRSLAWYEREAGVVARRLGWRPRHVVSAVLVLASDENEETIMAIRDLFARWLLLRATDLLDRIQTPPRGRRASEAWR